MTVFLNGSFVENAQINASDRGFLLGDGAFTTLCVSEGKVEFFEMHRSRLKEHLALLGIESPRILEEDVCELISVRKAHKGRWRLRITVSAGGSASERSLKNRPYGNHLMMLTPLTLPEKDALSLCVYPEPVVTPLSRIKSLAYLHRFYIKDYALKKGYDDCVCFDTKTVLLEASFANIFWIKKNVLFFPSKSLPYLFGITLAQMLLATEEMGYEIREGEYKLDDIEDEAHLFFCNAPLGIMPIANIENRNFSRDYDLEVKLRAAFFKRSEANSLVCSC